ncbi:uncharacterized protein LOC121382984 isoform X3 [Gigantopelta aegis]|uniref:uncharacterized protein LOC121382984 isoform X3 n=1 Tax=Gigantopelta aegis TaxID=1735272 RepID=UPI001B88B8E2|nr:uncharacterized protein LOC121382984 isoform X3 [Gigantopelta aegis]XP_041368631.1 uncharacterized protein LOC121382984 isoform X3 [Gigantopelta aegis]
MDKHYSEEFFFNFLEVLQKVCRDYLQFNDSVEVSGYLALDIDNTRKERYVLCELLNGAGHVVSESHCTKVFKTFHKKPLQTSSIENVVSGAPNGSESSVRNRNTDTDLNSVGELDSSEDFTNNNSVDPPHGSAVSVAGRRQTRSSRAVLGGTAQGLNCSPSSQQFTRDGDTSTMSLSSEKNNSKKKRGANTNLTSSAKKSKSAVGSECLNIVSDCSLLPQSYANTDSNEDGVSRSETPGFETDEHNEKICFPLTTTVTCKQEVMDDLDTLQLTCETISSESFVMDNNAQTFPDGAELVPCSSDSLPISDNKQENEDTGVQGTDVWSPTFPAIQTSSLLPPISRPKKVCKLLDIETKYHLIRTVEAGLKRKSVIAKEFGIFPNTLSTIMKNKQTTIDAWERCEFQPNRRRLRKSDHKPIDDALYVWYSEQVEGRNFMSGPILLAKATQIAQELGFTNFRPSTGFIDRFKSRHGIHLGKRI